MEGKTVAELAKELDVSVQTIYKRLNRFKTTFKDTSGRKIITPDQEEEIKRSFKTTDDTTTPNTQKILIDQLNQKDEIIKDLTNLLNQEQILHQNTQRKLDETQKLLEVAEEKTKKPPVSWWQKIRNMI